MITPASHFAHRYSFEQQEQNKFEGMRQRAADLRDKASALSGIEQKLKASQSVLDEREILLNAREEALRRRERVIKRREREANAAPPAVVPSDTAAPSASRSPWVPPPADNIDAVICAPIPGPPGSPAHMAWALEQAQRVLDCWAKWNGEIPHADLPFEPAHPLVTEADHRAWAKAREVLEFGRKWRTPDPAPDRIAVAREALELGRSQSSPSSPPARQMSAEAVIAVGKKWRGEHSRFVDR
jgi:hypothetical protein